MFVNRFAGQLDTETFEGLDINLRQHHTCVYLTAFQVRDLFKCFLSSKATIDAIPDENVGKGLKAAFAYFENKTISELDPLSNVVFCAMRPYIDEAFSDYEASVESGRRGANNRWNREDG